MSEGRRDTDTNKDTEEGGRGERKTKTEIKNRDTETKLEIVIKREWQKVINTEIWKTSEKNDIDTADNTWQRG